ncbi:MAG: serine/threonine-protein phosphatase [Peptococcaceae bacterium]|nr:serine/threonine-protein phosphatase [Peptococcaceae bacterium]
MDFIISAVTDIGIKKTTNQDSFNVRIFDTPMGKVVFAVLCDGMGGLSKGEVASATVVNAFCKWADQRLAALCSTGIQDADIRKEWQSIVETYNAKIKAYAHSCSTNMGTTVTAMLITPYRYYIANVGDTRAYEINDAIRILTKDQTVVAREIEYGHLTPEEAEKDPRRSVLLQCIGASDEVAADFFFGDTKLNCVYMLCTDGFRHEITADEIHQSLHPDRMLEMDGMKKNMEELVSLNKQRLEQDNISVIAIRTF